MAINTLEELFIEQLKDLYDAENRITVALPKMIQKAKNEDLRKGLAEHLEETKGHVNRLREIGSLLSVGLEGATCEATQGLMQEAEKSMSEISDPDVLDAAIIISVQRVEHYEIAGYGSAINFAENLNKDSELIDRLKDTLKEEKEADKELTKVATGGLLGSGVNEAAVK